MSTARLLLGFFAALVILGRSLPAEAQSGLQFSRDGQRVYVSKDVDDQRWSITRDLTTGMVWGLVYFPDGGEPLFIECDPQPSTGETFVLACYGTIASSTEWLRVEGDIEIPKSFFEPRQGPSPNLTCSIFSSPCMAQPIGDLLIAEGGEAHFTDPPLGRVSLGFGNDVAVSVSNSSFRSHFGSFGLTFGEFSTSLIRVSFDQVFGENPPGFVTLVPDGAVVMDVPGGDDGATGTCGTFPNLDVAARSLRQRVEICKVCGVGERVIGKFDIELQTFDGSTCRYAGEFSMIRDR